MTAIECTSPAEIATTISPSIPATSFGVENVAPTPAPPTTNSVHYDKTAEEVEKDSDRDYYMTADEAKDYGLVDEVITTRPSE